MRDKKNLVKILGLVASAAGIGVSLLSEWVTDKEIDAKIDEKLSERQLAVREETDENDEEEES